MPAKYAEILDELKNKYPELQEEPLLDDLLDASYEEEGMEDDSLPLEDPMLEDDMSMEDEDMMLEEDMEELPEDDMSEELPMDEEEEEEMTIEDELEEEGDMFFDKKSKKKAKR